MSETIKEKAFWIYCRKCSCEYLEPIAWVIEHGVTVCPRCYEKLIVYGE